MAREVIFDLETDGLLPEVSVIWCICLRVIEDSIEGPILSFVNNPETGEDTLDEAVEIIEDADVVIGHNALGYDLKVLDKLYGDFSPKPGQIVRDTQILAQMYYANEKDKDFDRHRRGTLEGKLIGRHGLEAWGQRLGHFKGDYAKEMKALGKDPWKEFDFDRGVPYCEDDIEVTSRLWRKIQNTDWSEEAIILEHQISELMALQEEFGFWFNRQEAERLAAELTVEHERLTAIAVDHFGKWWVPCKKYKAEPRAEFGEDDSRLVWGEVSIEKRPERKAKMKEGLFEGVYAHFSDDAPYCKVEIKEFNPNSRPQIIDRLKFVYGWEPVDFTEAGNPEVNDEVLRGLAKHWDICETLAELFFYSKILGQIANGNNAWLKLVDDDGFIHGRCNAGGTRSGRASHSNPNVAQVPKVKVMDVVNKETGEVNSLFLVNGRPIKDVIKEDGTYKKAAVLKGRPGDYGWECRSLFGAPKINGQQWWMMGCDLKGVELRCFGHHLAEYDNGAYADIVINGDVHTVNQNAAGLNSRDNAKTFIYACVDFETQALTKSGWKHYDDLEIGEMVLTYNLKRDCQEWKPILEKVRYEDADTVIMRNRKGTGVYEMVVTPNHRWPVNRTTTVNGVRCQVREFRQTHELNAAMSIIGNAPLEDHDSSFEMTGKNEINEKTILSMSSAERQAYLAGFMVADGHMRGTTWNWTQNRGDHAEAALMCSYLAHDGMIGAHTSGKILKGSLSSSRTWGCQKLEIVEGEKQPVWCIRTENESFVIRRGDFITQTGNTLYGAGDEKIGSIVCMPNTAISIMKARGKELKARFQEGLPAYRHLVKRIAKEARRGYLIGLDGRKLWVKSPHSALNLQLQSDGALLAKKWVCLFYQYMEEAGYVMGWDGDFVPCAWIHDEIQCACRTKEIAEHAQKLCEKAAVDAGKHFNYRVPIEADSKIGLNWAQTH